LTATLTCGLVGVACMDKYEIIRKVGSGSYSTAWLAKHRDSGELRVVKRIPFNRVAEKDRVEALNEVTILQQFDHPNIVSLKEFFMSTHRPRRADTSGRRRHSTSSCRLRRGGTSSPASSRARGFSSKKGKSGQCSRRSAAG
jgi:serine/threonine protein kinase